MGRAKVVVLTGAGISAESGVPTFRDADGLWEGHRVEEVATPEAFEAHPHVVHRFYDARRAALAGVDPNPAHHALADLEAVLGDDLLVVTQNVDDLHERAGSTRVHHMHGHLRSARCLACGARTVWHDDLAHGPACPTCGEPTLRPDIVWFGEVPHGMDLIEEALADAELFVSIGTSSMVYPAAGFVVAARHHGARTLELNLDRSAASSVFDETRHGPASLLVPAWVEEMLVTEGGRL
ncbi:NAD-dependent deacylase [Nocardioides sp.]|uniref:NAD-dependent deacylase n=1 Tax=Nocardioides sp. TaxID=35761 RepID=UPI003529380A